VDSALQEREGIPGRRRRSRRLFRPVDPLGLQDDLGRIQPRPSEIAADPVNLLVVLEERLSKEDLPDEYKRRLRSHIKEWIIPRLPSSWKRNCR